MAMPPRWVVPVVAPVVHDLPVQDGSAVFPLSEAWRLQAQRQKAMDGYWEYPPSADAAVECPVTLEEKQHHMP
jgi:hypothetical protein